MVNLCCIWMLAIVHGSFLVYTLDANTAEVYLNSSDGFQLYTSTTSPIFNASETHMEMEDEDILSCGAILLEPDEYTMLPNGSVLVEPFNKTYDPISYLLLNGTLMYVCPPELENQTETQFIPDLHRSFEHITRIGIGISMLSLVIHLIVFFIVADLRNPSGYNLASLCFSLFSAYVFYLVATDGKTENFRTLCIGVGATFQFLMTSSFLWMCLISFDVFISILNATGKLRRVSQKFSCKKYCINCLFSCGIPLLFVMMTLVLDNISGVPDNFKPNFGKKRCWFVRRNPMLILFVGPIMTTIIFNVIFFVLSAYMIFSNRMKADGDEAYKRQLKRNFSMYSRLAIIMGLAWIIGVVAGIFSTPWLHYIHAFVNSLQGFFIFLAFTCTDKVREYFSSKLNLSELKSLPTSTSSTFQSCWISGRSLDDLTTLQEDNMIELEKVS